MFERYDAGFDFYDAGIMYGIPNSLECDSMGEASMMSAREISDAAIVETLESLDDAGALELLDTLTPDDAARIARKLGA